MSLTTRLINLELIMAANKHYETVNHQEDTTLRQLEDVLCTFNAEKIDIKKQEVAVYESQETYRRCTARKRLEFCDFMDCYYEESSAELESSFKRMTKQERGLLRRYATISMEEDAVDFCLGQYKRRRYE
nr:uncharacterized protein LOC118682199 [Bactrocera oleae]